MLRQFNEETRKIEGAESELYNFVLDRLYSLFGCNAEFNIVNTLSQQVKSVEENKSDILLNLIQEENMHSESLEFTIPIGYLYLYLYCGKPLSVPTTFLAVLDIFDRYVWFSITVTMILAPLLTIPRTLSSYVTEIFFLFSKSIGQNDTNRLSDSRPMVFHLFYTIPAFILTNLFVNVLLSKLTLPPKPIYVESIDDLFGHPSMLLLVTAKNKLPKNVYPRLSDGNIDDSRVMEIFKLEAHHSPFETFYEATAKMKTGELCLGIPDLGVSVFMETFGYCLEASEYVHKSKTFFSTSPRVLAMRRSLNPAIKRKFKDIPFYFRESGIAEMEVQTQTFKNERCFIQDVEMLDRFTTLNIRSISLPLTILLAGLLFRALILFYHIYYIQCSS